MIPEGKSNVYKKLNNLVVNSLFYKKNIKIFTNKTLILTNKNTFFCFFFFQFYFGTKVQQFNFYFVYRS